MKRIILVEDDFIIALLLEKQILRMGYQITSIVNDAKDIIERVQNESPDLILMDIKLVGEMDGIEAMMHIRQFSNVPVIYLTGNADNNTIKRAQATYPIGYLIKPVDMEVLKRTIREVLNKSSTNS